jgi:hypothetical protein
MSTATDNSQGTAPTHPAGSLDPTDAADAAVMTLLHDHVPLALLCDLTLPEGPESAAILAEEGEPESRWWEPAG